jgi:hypothetical protein
MARKIFLEHNGLKLCGDDRDVMVPKRHYWDVMVWCQDQGILVEGAFDQADYETRLSAMLFDVNLWRIRNEEHRVLFILRWS